MAVMILPMVMTRDTETIKMLCNPCRVSFTYLLSCSLSDLGCDR
jgi:hypothetical protein